MKKAMAFECGIGRIILKTDQGNRTGSIEIDPHLYGPLILDKDVKTLHGKDRLFSKQLSVWGKNETEL